MANRATVVYGHVCYSDQEGRRGLSGLSTKHVVLGLLADRTSYGYALQQQLSDRFGFLGLAESAVYKTLDRLEADGCVEHAGEKSVGRTSRVLYRATPDGVEQFRQWMVQPARHSPVREELHAKLILAGPEDLPNLLASVEQQAQACLAELANLADGRRSVGDPSAHWDATARLLVDSFKARRLESLVDWLGEVAEAIHHYLEAPEGSARRPLG